jgi:hypothetical protein
MECNHSIISREHREPSLHSRDRPALEVIDQFTTFAASRLASLFLRSVCSSLDADGRVGSRLGRPFSVGAAMQVRSYPLAH